MRHNTDNNCLWYLKNVMISIWYFEAKADVATTIQRDRMTNHCDTVIKVGYHFLLSVGPTWQSLDIMLYDLHVTIVEADFRQGSVDFFHV